MISDTSCQVLMLLPLYGGQCKLMLLNRNVKEMPPGASNGTSFLLLWTLSVLVDSVSRLFSCYSNVCCTCMVTSGKGMNYLGHPMLTKGRDNLYVW